MKRAATIAGLVSAFLLGYGYSRWNNRTPEQVSAKTGPAILYYRCPMHPSIHSDKPGVAPCCHMDMVPVYATAATSAEQLPTGALRISTDQEQLLGLKYTVVKPGTLAETVHAVARIVPDETRIAHVQTRLDGYVDQILVKTVGTEVRKGQVLMTVYHPKALAAQEEYINAVKTVMGVNEESGGRTNGPRPANAEGVMAAGRLRLELMGFTEPQIETITQAMQPMRRLPLLAPIGGVVTEVNALARQRIVPESLFTITDLSSVWALADILAYETTPVAVGDSASLRIPALPGRVFHATVDALLPAVDSTTHSRRIRLRMDNPERLLLPEMQGDLEIRASTARRALIVPREAVLDRGRRQIVFVERETHVLENRDVVTGRRSADTIEVLRGLRAGERVVTSGHFLLDSESRLSAEAVGSHDRSDH
jgi:RND family efflux transporter MFP subunit